MYVIKIFEKNVSQIEIPIGYFYKCYICSVHQEKGTFIGWSEKENCKKFKTKKAAENKILFLNQKKEINHYLDDFRFEIEEINEMEEN